MSREDNIYFARLAEQGERYEDMIRYMKLVATVSPPPILIQTVRPPTVQRGAQLAFSRIQKLSWHQESRVAHLQRHPGQRGVQGFQALGPD